MFKPLLPEEVAPQDAAAVLSFLNGAVSAEEIADTVEIPDQRDIGLRLAQRLLNRRAELGGFSNLAQVLATPLIGPQRFTQIVITLSAARTELLPDNDLNPLLEEISALKRQVEILGQRGGAPRAHIRLSPLRAHTWHGQTTVVLVEVCQADGSPWIDAPIAFSCVNGTLLRSNTHESEDGRTLLTRTNDLGMVQLRLCSGEIPAPDADAAGALEIALSGLDLAADYPDQLQAAFEAISDSYRAPDGRALRAAIDTRFGAEIRGLSNVDAPSHWRWRNVTLHSFINQLAGTDADGDRPDASSSIILRSRDWLPAWLYHHRRNVENRNPARTELDKLSTAGDDHPALLARMIGVIQAYQGNEPGLASEIFKDHMSRTLLHQHIEKNAKVFGFEGLSRLVPDASRAQEILRSGGRHMLKAVESTKSSVRKDIRVRLPADVGTRLSTLESQTVKESQLLDLRQQILNETDVKVAAARTDLQVQLNQKADTTVVNTELTQLKRDRDQLVLKTGELDVKFTDFEKNPGKALTVLAQVTSGVGAGQILQPGAAAGTFVHTVSLTLNTGGQSENILLDSVFVNLALSTIIYDVTAPGAPESATLSSFGGDTLLRLPAARRVVQIKLFGDNTGRKVRLFRRDGDNLSNDPVDQANHGADGALLDVIATELVIRSDSGTIPPGAIDVIHVAPTLTNVRVALAMPALSATDLFYLAPSLAPGSAAFQQALNGLVQDLFKRLRRTLVQPLLPAQIGMNLVIQADAPAAVSVSAPVIHYRLQRSLSLDQQPRRVIEFGGGQQRTEAISLTLPPFSVLHSASMEYDGDDAQVSPEAVGAGNNGATDSAGSATGQTIRAGEAMASAITVTVHQHIRGIVLSALMYPASAGGELRLYRDGDGRPRDLLARAPLPPAPIGTRASRLQVNFETPVGVIGGQYWVGVHMHDGTLVWLLQPDASAPALVLEDGRSKEWRAVESSKGQRTMTALLGSVPGDTTAAATTQVRVNDHPLTASRSAPVNLLPAIGATDTGLTISVASSARTRVTFYAPVVTYDAPL